MSCSTLNTSAVRMNVAAGMLPEGFCPESMQQLFDAMATRLIVTPNTVFNSFAIGSVAPTSNVGPWFKDCATWFVWDDTTAAYIPMTKGGFNAEEYHTSSGSFIVPAFTYKIRVNLWGAGGGGHNGSSGGGGGGGGYTRGIFNVLPGQVIPYVIGTGGATGSPASDGLASTFLTMTSGGGLKGTSGPGGAGGVAAGGDMNINGGYGREGYAADPGDGGSSPQGGAGGTDTSSGSVAAATGVVPGGGGAGAAGLTSGPGANGGVLIEY